MRIAAVLIAVLIALASRAATAEPRIALVIGDNAYHGGLKPLRNAVNDARLISATLRQAGFEVDELHDADGKRTAAAVAALKRRLAASGPGAVGLF